MIIIELIPLTSYAADKTVYLEVEDIAPREGIQGQKSIFTVSAKDSFGTYLPQISIAFYVDGKEIKVIQTDQTGYINVSYQFLSAGKYNIGFSVYGADNQANIVEMTYTVNENSTMDFTCQREVTYGSTMLLSTDQKEGIIDYKIVAGDGAAYITGDMLTATKVGNVTIQAALKNEDGQIVNQATLNLQILPKEVSYTAKVNDKIYTGTPEATYNQISPLEGVIEGDDVTLLPGNPIFESADAGVDRKIWIEGAGLEGNDAANYKIVPPNNLIATINKRVVTIKNTEIAEKVYDGTVQASFQKTPVLENVCDIDKNSVELIIPNIKYQSAEAGEKKEIIVTSSFALKGEKVANYELEQPKLLSGRIKKAVLIVKADDKRRAYGKKNPALAYTIKGFVKGESEETIKEFQKPNLICHANRKSKPGSYMIQIQGGNPGVNYEFQYRTGTMIVTKKEETVESPSENESVVPVRGIHYKVSKPNGNNQWFTKGNFQITPRLESGFDKISISPIGPWLNTLRYMKDTRYRNITFYLKNTKTGELSNVATEYYQMDKKNPKVSYEVLTTTGEKAIPKNQTAFGSIYESGCYVKINALDKLSGIDQIKYYTVDANTGKKSAIYREKTGHVQVPLPNRFKGYVYGIITDKAGNQITVGTDGIIVTEESIEYWNNDGIKDNGTRKKKDKNSPVIKITYEDKAVNGVYYNASRTAKIQILDYELENVTIKIKRDGEVTRKQLIVTKDKKLFQDTKKNPYYIYTGYVTFEENGRYTIDISCIDKAGNKNKGIRYTEGSNALTFIIDKRKPEIQFRQLKANQSYNGEVQPSFLLKDKNLDMDSLSYSLLGIKRGELALGGKAVTYPGGYLYVLDNIPKEITYDDNYILTVSIKDKAGNSVSKTMPFRVNRKGSHYTLDAYTKKVNQTYKKEISDIAIIESNLDKLKEETICVFLNHNGIVYPLSKVKDYTITYFGDGTDYYQYMYIFSSKLFQQNGIYQIGIMSEDTAGNENYNFMNQKESVCFTIDKTYPTLVQSNLTNGKVYFSKKYEAKISLKDNIKLLKMSVKLNGKEIKKKVTKEGDITFLVNNDIRNQKLEIIAKDSAGNKITYSYSFYVTKNPFIWLLKAKISKKVKLLFLLCFLICSFGIVTILFLIIYLIKQMKQ